MAVFEIGIPVRIQLAEFLVIEKQLVAGSDDDFVAINGNAPQSAIGPAAGEVCVP